MLHSHANYVQGKWIPALESYSKMGDAFENDIFYLNEVAECHEKLSNLKEAINIYERILQLDPENVSVHERLEALREKN